MATYYTQPRFNSHIYTLANPITGTTNGGLRRGFMIWETTITGYKKKAVVHYLYNPSTVQADYSATASAVNNPQLNQLYQIGDSNNAQLVVAMSQSASWSIMFDRTYELRGQTGNDGNDINDPAVAGVGVDVLQMMQFTGMLTNTGKTTSATAGSKANLWPGPMLLVPSFAYFGKAGNNAVRYYGYINEWDVTYTHWTEKMVPMRCVVDISWSMLPNPPSVISDSTDPSNWIQGKGVYTGTGVGHRTGPGNGVPGTLSATIGAGVSGR